MFVFSELLSSSNSLTFSRRRGVCVVNFGRILVFCWALVPLDVVERIEKAGTAMKTMTPAAASMAMLTVQVVYCDDFKSLLSTVEKKVVFVVVVTDEVL